MSQPMSQENESSGRRKTDLYSEAERQIRLALAVERTNDKIERTNQDLVRVAASVDGLVGRVTSVVDRIIERLESRVNEIGAHIETRLDRIDARIDKLDDDIIQLRAEQASSASALVPSKAAEEVAAVEPKQDETAKSTVGLVAGIIDRLDQIKLRTWILSMLFLLVGGFSVGVFVAVRDALKDAGLSSKAASAPTSSLPDPKERKE